MSKQSSERKMSLPGNLCPALRIQRIHPRQRLARQTAAALQDPLKVRPLVAVEMEATTTLMRIQRTKTQKASVLQKGSL
jgi:hypothetical protein